MRANRSKIIIPLTNDAQSRYYVKSVKRKYNQGCLKIEEFQPTAEGTMTLNDHDDKSRRGYVKTPG